MVGMPQQVTNIKVCKDCKQEKSTDDFYKRNEYKDSIYLSSYCIACSKRRMRQSGLKRNYNLTNSMWQEMFEKQQGCCAICGRHQREFKKALNTDHNHLTGRVRDLLCSGCNKDVGIYEERKTELEAYLSKH